MHRLAGVVASVVLAGCGSSPPPVSSGQPDVAIVHVTVIDPATGNVQPNQTIAITGNRITSVEPTGDSVHAGRVLDATGKFAIPGLWDMHIHTFFGDWTPGADGITLPLLLANGVTGARDMGSELEPILAARADIAAHKIVGPRLVIAGPMLDGEKSPFPAAIKLKTPGDARKAVDMLADKQVDFLKIQSFMTNDVYTAIVAEATKRHMIFAGHVPDAVRTRDAMTAGQKSFEHLIGVFEASSTKEDDFLATGGKAPAKFLDSYDASKEAALLDELAAHHVWQCPTLFWERGQWLVDAPYIVEEVKNDPDGTYVPLTWRTKIWPQGAQGIKTQMDTDPLPVREKFVEHELHIVKRMHDKGIPLLAGTDGPAGIDTIPGASLHHELERFVAAGLSPLEALKTATSNPALYLGRDDVGAIATNKLADVLILDRNPLEDIKNTRAIQTVIADGHVYTRADLDGALAAIAALAATR